MVTTVYPRWRGEHQVAGNLSYRDTGLSPLARGTRVQRTLKTPLRRFIPAGAGNTVVSRGFFEFRPVYPRWRGEHPLIGITCSAPSGLSPLARGTLYCNSVQWSVKRFIPAGAGNTTICSNISAVSRVYPRWRGEHVSSRNHAGSAVVYPRWRGEHRCYREIGGG